MATGELRGAFSMSEPELGSDVAAIRTKGASDTDGTYRIDGAKMWLTSVAVRRWWRSWSAPTTT